jgi:hypothetical protein
LGRDIFDTLELANEVSKVCQMSVNENNEPSSSDEEHDMLKISDDKEVKANDDERCCH